MNLWFIDITVKLHRQTMRMVSTRKSSKTDIYNERTNNQR